MPGLGTKSIIIEGTEITNLPKGIYLLKISGTDFIISKKVIKN
jgi:hypothetical protein